MGNPKADYKPRESGAPNGPLMGVDEQEEGHRNCETRGVPAEAAPNAQPEVDRRQEGGWAVPLAVGRQRDQEDAQDGLRGRSRSEMRIIASRPAQ